MMSLEEGERASRDEDPTEARQRRVEAERAEKAARANRDRRSTRQDAANGRVEDVAGTGPRL